MHKRPQPFLVTTEVQRNGANHRATHLVYAKSERAAVSEAVERESQAWQWPVLITTVSAVQA
jgi:hypothetical protein